MGLLIAALTGWDKVLIFGAIVIALAGCKGDAKLEGISLYKNGTDKVVLFHGFVDNFSECMRLAEIYNSEANKEAAAYAAIGKEPARWTCAK